MRNALAQEDFESIGMYVKEHLPLWLSDLQPSQLRFPFEIELRERTIRLEEGQIHLREEMKRHFELMEKRFEQVDKRFEQVDKRFEQVDKRFEQVDKRFEEINQRLDRFMRWSFATSLTLAGAVIAAIKLL